MIKFTKELIFLFFLKQSNFFLLQMNIFKVRLFCLKYSKVHRVLHKLTHKLTQVNPSQLGQP